MDSRLPSCDVCRVVSSLLELKSGFNLHAADVIESFHALHGRESEDERGQKAESSFVFVFFRLLLHSSHNDALHKIHTVVFLCLSIRWGCFGCVMKTNGDAAALQQLCTPPHPSPSEWDLYAITARGRRAPTAPSLQLHLQAGLRSLNAFQSIDLRMSHQNLVLYSQIQGGPGWRREGVIFLWSNFLHYTLVQSSLVGHANHETTPHIPSNSYSQSCLFAVTEPDQSHNMLMAYALYIIFLFEEWDWEFECSQVGVTEVKVVIILRYEL